MAKRILLIDDEELVVKSVTRALQREGYEVIACRSGNEAIERVKKEPVDLIVCDVRMPQLNGIETVKQIRALYKSKDKNTAPEILMTGYADEVATKEIEALEVADYLYKPFDLRGFLAVVRKSLKA